MELRPYQKDAIKALWNYWREFPAGRGIIVCPTGGGKSFIIANIIQQIRKKRPDFRFLIATHTQEIVSQNAKELAGITSEPIGIFSAGLGSKIIRKITFANIQSIHDKNIEVDMLIIDEAHMVSKKDTSMYQRLIRNLEKKKPVAILGLTATPMRMDQGSLVAPGSIFNDIVYDISVSELISKGYLSPVVSFSKKEVDLTGVKSSGYDYNQTDLQYAFNKDDLIKAQVKDIKEAAKDRKHILVFCTGIEHAKKVAEILRGEGISADYVSGDMIPYERENKIRSFEDGSIRALCNVGILTTGFNFKPIDCVVLLRATKSTALYLQSVGRGTRTAPGKENCLVLDYGGNIKRHGPIDAVTIKTKSRVDEKAVISKAPTKTCEKCGCVVGIGAIICPSCEWTFPDRTIELTKEASDAPILSRPENFVILTWEVKKHVKKADPLAPPSLKLEYKVGMFQTLCEYLCFDHEGFAKREAGRKWVRAGGLRPVPESVDEALKRQAELASPAVVRAVKKGKHWEIREVTYREDEYYLAP